MLSQFEYNEREKGDGEAQTMGTIQHGPGMRRTYHLHLVASVVSS